jgi:hypothetical protein
MGGKRGETSLSRPNPSHPSRPLPWLNDAPGSVTTRLRCWPRGSTHMAEWDTQNLLQYRDEIIGIFGIIIGVVVSIVTYLKTRRHIGASYYISTDRLIGPMGPRFLGLEILYDGKKVSSFSSSKIFIWNRGTDAIRAGDIAPSWPLKIILSDSNCVLDHRTLYCSSMHSKLSTTLEDDGQIAISFDYLDPKQGAVLEVLHTGEGGPLYLTGSIIGGGEIKLRKTLVAEQNC